MSLTEAEVQHLADLARLGLAADEIKNFTSQLSGVVDYIATLRSLAGQVSTVNQSAGVSLRIDQVKEYEETEALIKAAAQQQNNQIVVPEVFSDRQ